MWFLCCSLVSIIRLYYNTLRATTGTIKKLTYASRRGNYLSPRAECFYFNAERFDQGRCYPLAIDCFEDSVESYPETVGHCLAYIYLICYLRPVPKG